MSSKITFAMEELIRYWLADIYKHSNLFDLFIMLGKVYNNQSMNNQIDNIMNFMEDTFSIPILSIDIDNWLLENESNQLILTLYQELSDMLLTNSY